MSNDRSTAIRTRGPELAVAAFLLAIALLVITDSLRVGIGWADDGPRASLADLAEAAGVSVATL